MPTINSQFDKTKLKSLEISFLLDHEISKKTKKYNMSTEAQWSPLGSKIFGFPWVNSVEIKPKEIIIKREDWVEWDMLAEPVKDMIDHHFTLYDEQDEIEENQEPKQKAVKETQIPAHAKPIHDFIQEAINPQLAQHGGNVELIDFQNGVLYLEMQGGCQGCGMAAQTMRDGIEVAIKNEFPEVVELKDITNHSEGESPYYAPKPSQ